MYICKIYVICKICPIQKKIIRYISPKILINPLLSLSSIPVSINLFNFPTFKNKEMVLSYKVKKTQCKTSVTRKMRLNPNGRKTTERM